MYLGNYCKFLFLCVLCTLNITNLYALSIVKNQPVNLSADNIKIDNQAHKAYILGNVRVEQGATLLLAHSVEIKSDNTNTPELIKALGNKHKQAYFKTIPKKDAKDLHAWANKILYYPKDNIIKLIGDAKVKSDLNKLSAPVIVYDTQNEKIISQGNENNRIQIILQNDSNLKLN